MVPQVRTRWTDAGPISEKGPKEFCSAFPSPTVPEHQDLSRVADNPTLHGALSGGAATMVILPLLSFSKCSEPIS